MKNLGTITVATLGAGFAGQLHGEAYELVHGMTVRLKTIVDPIRERADKQKEHFGYELALYDDAPVYDDPEIDVIDICTPPMLHKTQILKALKAGKHVICEKPLIGYFGEEGDPEPVGIKVPKSKMYEKVLQDVEEIRAAVKESGKCFCYAENYVYAASILKAADIVQKKKSKLLFLKGEQSLRGTVSLGGGEWSHHGGGALIRAGVHPLSAILMLKTAEAKARGEKCAVRSVVAETGMATRSLSEEEHDYIYARPNDVEDFCHLSMVFADGTTAQINTSDLRLGAPVGYVDIYGSDMLLKCQVQPANPMTSYFLDEKNMEDISLEGIISTTIGWSEPAVAGPLLRGFTGEIQDFCECIMTGREPFSGLDIASDTIRLVYAAYRSAEEGRRIDL